MPVEVRTDLYLRAGAAPAGPPSKATIWRVLTDCDADAFDTAIGAWLTGRRGLVTAEQPAVTHLRLDGKTIRGAVDADGQQLHLIAAMIGPPGTAVVAAQATVDGTPSRPPRT